MKKKKTKAQLNRISKRKNLVVWSKQVRDRDKVCVVCGREDYLNAHHILPKENYKELMFEILNGITLCPTHHKFGKYSAHKNPMWFVNFLQEYHIAQYTWATKNVGDIETHDRTNKK